MWRFYYTMPTLKGFLPEKHLKQWLKLVKLTVLSCQPKHMCFTLIVSELSMVIVDVVFDKFFI